MPSSDCFSSYRNIYRLYQDVTLSSSNSIRLLNILQSSILAFRTYIASSKPVCKSYPWAFQNRLTRIVSLQLPALFTPVAPTIILLTWTNASLTHIFFCLRQFMSLSPHARLVNTVQHLASILHAKQIMALQPTIQALHFGLSSPIFLYLLSKSGAQSILIFPRAWKQFQPRSEEAMH